MSIAFDHHAAFETRIDSIVRLAGYHFRQLGPEAREEAIQNTLALAWKFFLRLVEQGKADQENVVSQMIGFAIKHTKMGRSLVGTDHKRPKDVIDYAKRRMRGVAIEPMEIDHYIGKSASVPDSAAFRIDTPAFLATLSERDRGIALDLATGMGTTEAAHKWSLSPGAISQFRTRFKAWYDQFHGEA